MGYKQLYLKGVTMGPCDVMVRVLTCEFNSQPVHCKVAILGKLFTHTDLCHQAI